MERAIEIGTVLVEAHRDLHRLGQCEKMLASPDLVQAFKEKMMKQQDDLYLDARKPRRTGKLFFMGVLVVECEILEGLEYAIVRKGVSDERTATRIGRDTSPAGGT